MTLKLQVLLIHYFRHKRHCYRRKYRCIWLQAAYLKRIEIAMNKKALVIGAGGVSPSVIFSLEKSGIKNISITNRTHEKCLFLKKKFNFLNIFPWSNLTK